MKSHLYRALEQISEENLVRFHYPGHKGRNLYFPCEKLADYDMTETFGTDDLQAPTDVLLESQREAARVFNTLNTFYGVGGSTMSNYAAIAAGTNPGEEILIQRNAHRSIYDGAMLAGLNIRTISPEYDRDFGLLTGIDLKKFQWTLERYPKVRTVVLTNPSYYGVCLKLRELVEIAHSHHCLVIVDEAHGAHLHFSSLKDYSAISAGADLIVHSAHKSLPAMTSTSLLHRNTEVVSLEKLRRFYNLYMTSSPSYILLLSIESAIAEMEAEGEEKLRALEASVDEFIPKYKNLGAKFWSQKRAQETTACFDFTKLFFNIPGYTGQELLEALYNKGINLEFADGNHVLGVLSTETNQEDFRRLYRALKALPKGTSEAIRTVYEPIETETVYSLKEAFYMEGEWIPIEEAEDYVALDFLQLYPPGIPMLIPGERIPKALIELIDKDTIQGIKDGKVRVGK